MNRKEKRALEKKGIISKYNPETQSRLKFTIDLPPGLLRDDGKSSRSGQFTADNDVDLTRGMFVKLLESFGYINQQQAVVGLFASVVNPFPKNMRGALAYAIINGTGLMLDEQEVEVCTLCEAEKLQTLDMSEEAMAAPDDECQVDRLVGVAVSASGCSEPPDADIHQEDHKDWLHAFEESELPMIDTTPHADNCPARPLAKDEAMVDGRTPDEPQWKEVTAIVVLTPQMYEPLQPQPTEDDVVVDTGCHVCGAAADADVHDQTNEVEFSHDFEVPEESIETEEPEQVPDEKE